MKKIIQTILILLVAVIVGLALVPFVFKDKVEAKIKEEINKQVNAKVDFEGSSLSLLKDFPNASIGLKNISIKGTDQFEGVPLFNANGLDFSMNLSSIFGGSDLEINHISLRKADINVLVDKTGKANYDIMKSSSNDSSSTPFSANLESYEIVNSNITYSDQSSNNYLGIKGLDHRGKGKFSNTVFDLVTNTKANSIDFKSGAISYLEKAKLNSKLDLAVDLNNNSYTLKENNIELNELELQSSGVIKKSGNGYNIDLDLKAPDNDFKDLFSAIPNAYNDDFKDLEARGRSDLHGSIKGLYSDNSFPSFDLNISGTDGFVKYPSYPESISDIDFNMKLKSTDSKMENLSVNIPNMSFVMGGEKFVGNMDLQNALGNFLLKASGNGKIDLFHISRLFPVEGVQQMSGIADINMNIKSDKNSIENSDYGAMELDGKADISNLKLKYDKYPELSFASANMEATPKLAKVKTSKAQFGKSDFIVQSEIINPLALLTDKAAKAKLDIKSDQWDLNEMMKLSSSDENSAQTVDSSTENSAMPNVDLDYDVSAKKIIYEDYDLANMHVNGSINAQELKIKETKIDFDRSTIKGSGELTNLSNYVLKEETLGGNINIRANKIDLNRFYSEEESTDDEDLQVVVLPKNMDIAIDGDINEISYGKYLLKNIDGVVKLSKGIADFKNVNMNLFGGDLDLNGFYDSSMEQKPTFELDYNLADVAFEDLVKVSPSFAKLAPIAKFMTGKLNTTLSMSGPLGQDMMPLLNEITADGFLETLNSTLKGFTPLQTVGDKLGIAALKNPEIKNTKNWFTIKDGFVNLKEQSREIDDMKFTVGGRHSIDQEIDYKISAQIPRELLKSNVGTKLLDNGLGILEKEAGKRGVDIGLGDFINMDIFLTGSITKPKLKLVPTGSGGKSTKDVLKDELNRQTDRLKDTLQKEAEKKIKVIKDKANEKLDETKKDVEKKAKVIIRKQTDQIKDKASEKVKEVIDSTITKKVEKKVDEVIKDKAGDVLGDKTKDIEKKAGGLIKDIFKKKKKN